MSELDSERKKNRQLESRIAQLESEVKAAQDQAAAAGRALREKEEFAAVLAADRDVLARSLVAEAEKVRQQLEARARSQEEWSSRLDEAHKRLESELARAATLDAAVCGLRAQIATLAEHLAEALQDKDAALSRCGTWSQERDKLLQTLRGKDEMITLLSSTFQGMLKKE